MNFEDIFAYSGLTIEDFSNTFSIPKKKIIKWIRGEKECPEYVLKLLYYVVPIHANLRRIEFNWDKRPGDNKKMVIMYNNAIISDKKVRELVASGEWEEYNKEHNDFILMTPEAGEKTFGKD